jgi:hypothetical protein
MESAITEAFLQTVRGLVQKCMEDTDLEARKYALVMKTLYGAAPATPASDASRVNILEGMVDNLIHEIGELDARLGQVEQTGHDTWNGFGSGAAEPLGDEEVIDVATTEDAVVVVKESAEVHVIAAPAPAPVIQAPVPVIVAPAPAPVVQAPAPAPVPVIVAPVIQAPVPVIVAPTPEPAPAPVVQAPAPDNEEENDEDEEEDNPLEEINIDGKTYYKDEENLVYMLNMDDELDDTPIGRYMAKTNKIRYFPKVNPE